MEIKDNSIGNKKTPNYKENQHLIKFRLPDGISIKLGDVVYAVEGARPQHFYGNCPCCNGIKPLMYNGYEFTCPACKGVGNGHAVLTVKSFAVRRYRCVSIGENINLNDWAPKDGHPHAVEIVFQRRVGKSYYGDGGTFKLTSQVFGIKRRQRETETVGTFGDFHREFGAPLYFSYIDATKAADKLNAIESEVVRSYNEQHGTNFEFKIPEYDVRSK